MSLRALLRILFLSFAIVGLSPFLWASAGPILLAVGLAVPALALGYLLLISSELPISRWQLRYAGEGNGRLNDMLAFLAARAGHIVLEANPDGLFLEAPRAMDEYVEAQLPLALPELKLSAVEAHDDSAGTFYLCVSTLTYDLMHWATEGPGRQIRLHLHAGPYVTAIAHTNDAPPGHWLRLPLPRLLTRLWHCLPIWDELSRSISPGSLFPPAVDGAVYSSRSSVLGLVPPMDYRADRESRLLGESSNGQHIALDRAVPLFTVSAPPSFLVSQAIDDLQPGHAVVVVSTHRRILELIARQAESDVPCYWLDPENAAASAHLALVPADEWGTRNPQTVVHATETFLTDLGVDLALPAIGLFTRHLLHCLVISTRMAGRDLSLTDLYAISQGTQPLRTFLDGLREIDLDVETKDIAAELGRLLSDDSGYVQAVAALGTLRAALQPLKDAWVGALCRGPFLDLKAALGARCLLLAPLTAATQPEHNRFLAALLDLALGIVVQDQDISPLAAHLHDPHLYRTDGGQRWLDLARQNSRLSLLIDTQDPNSFRDKPDVEPRSTLFFHCSDDQSEAIVREHSLPCPVSDLADLPAGVALARLPGMIVAVQTGGN